MSIKQRQIKIEPRIRLNYNIYIHIRTKLAWHIAFYREKDYLRQVQVYVLYSKETIWPFTKQVTEEIKSIICICLLGGMKIPELSGYFNLMFHCKAIFKTLLKKIC